MHCDRDAVRTCRAEVVVYDVHAMSMIVWWFVLAWASLSVASRCGHGANKWCVYLSLAAMVPYGIAWVCVVWTWLALNEYASVNYILALRRGSCESMSGTAIVYDVHAMSLILCCAEFRWASLRVKQKIWAGSQHVMWFLYPRSVMCRIAFVLIMCGVKDWALPTY